MPDEWSGKYLNGSQNSVLVRKIWIFLEKKWEKLKFHPETWERAERSKKWDCTNTGVAGIPGAACGS